MYSSRLRCCLNGKSEPCKFERNLRILPFPDSSPYPVLISILLRIACANREVVFSWTTSGAKTLDDGIYDLQKLCFACRKRKDYGAKQLEEDLQHAHRGQMAQMALEG